MVYKPCKLCGERVPKVQGRRVCAFCRKQQMRDQKHQAYWQEPEKYRTIARAKIHSEEDLRKKRIESRVYYARNRFEIAKRRKLRRDENNLRKNKCR